MKPLTSLFGRNASMERKAKEHYASLVTRARASTLYTDYGVPDTLDGRFEAIIIHLFIEEMRLKNANALDPEWIRLLHEAFFADMDRSLREGGVGDTGISKRVQRMASGFYGRLTSYRDCLNDEFAFREALMRNVYGTSEPSNAQDKAPKLAAYIQQSLSHGICDE